MIEEKGSKPETYIIVNYADYNSLGSKDNIVNLVDNVYGYQECWCVIRDKDFDKYMEAHLACFNEPDEEKRMDMITKMVNDFSYYITHRVVTTQFSHDYVSEYIWIQKGDNNGRTIYSKN